MAHIHWLLVACTLYCSGTKKVDAVTHYDQEKALRTAVLDAYIANIRPSSQVTVKVRLNLLSINVLDVPTQHLSVSGWLTFTWMEPRLTWDPAKYGGIKDLFDTEAAYWRPEIIVDNSVSNLGVLESDKLLIRATYDGNMTWEPPGIFETHCDVDVTFYPFDTQVCVVEVTSWAYTMTEVDLYPYDSQIYLADYQESGEWDVMSSWTERKELLDGNDLRSEIAFSLKLQRKPQYYITTILIPVIVTSILCVLVFLLPAESGEKVGYSLTILLTYTVMLTLVASYLPPTSKHTSVLGIYLTIILFIGVFSTLLSVVILMLHHRSEQEVPAWLQNLTRGCMAPIARWEYVPPKNSVSATENERQATEQSGNPVRIDSRTHMSDVSRHGEAATTFINQRPTQKQNVVGIKRQNAAGFARNEDEIIQYSEYNHSSEHDFTWQEIAAILDIVCLKVLGFLVFVLTVTVLLTLIIGGYVI